MMVLRTSRGLTEPLKTYLRPRTIGGAIAGKVVLFLPITTRTAAEHETGTQNDTKCYKRFRSQYNYPLEYNPSLFWNFGQVYSSSLGREKSNKNRILK